MKHKFSTAFEMHKIPEWYNNYFDYIRLLNTLKDDDGKIKKTQRPLEGQYKLPVSILTGFLND